jgi:hypothetical protein
MRALHNRKIMLVPLIPGGYHGNTLKSVLHMHCAFSIHLAKNHAATVFTSVGVGIWFF